MSLQLVPDFFPSYYDQFSRIETDLLEAKLLLRLVESFNSYYQDIHHPYFKLLKVQDQREFDMIDANFLRLLISDIIGSGEYTLEGIAHFVRLPLDVIVETASGLNQNPSLILAARIIKLHSDLRKSLYVELIRRVLDEQDG